MSQPKSDRPGGMSALADPTNVDLRIVDDVPDADDAETEGGMSPDEIKALLDEPVDQRP